MKKTFLCTLLLLSLIFQLSACEISSGDLLKLTEAKGIPEESGISDENTEDGTSSDSDTETDHDGLVINTSSKRVHLSADCRHVATMKDKNKLLEPYSELDSYLENGYEICSNCEKNYTEGAK